MFSSKEAIFCAHELLTQVPSSSGGGVEEGDELSWSSWGCDAEDDVEGSGSKLDLLLIRLYLSIFGVLVGVAVMCNEGT